MPILNHMGIPAHDKEVSGRFFAETMNVRYSGIDPHADVAVVRVNESLSLQFYDAERFDGLHLAFHVSEDEFDGILARLKARGLPYGNDPEAPDNLLTDHVWGGRGIYFLDPNGHLFEILTRVE